MHLRDEAYVYSVVTNQQFLFSITFTRYYQHHQLNRLGNTIAIWKFARNSASNAKIISRSSFPFNQAPPAVAKVGSPLKKPASNSSEKLAKIAHEPLSGFQEDYFSSNFILQSAKKADFSDEFCRRHVLRGLQTQWQFYRCGQVCSTDTNKQGPRIKASDWSSAVLLDAERRHANDRGSTAVTSRGDIWRTKALSWRDRTAAHERERGSAV